MGPETPAEVQHQEDWVNRTLQPDYPGVHVCLHADVTVTHHGDGSASVECDYCPAMASVATGEAVRPSAWYFTETGLRV